MAQQDRGKSGQKAGGQKQQAQSGQGSKGRQDGGSRTGTRQGSQSEGNGNGNVRNRGASGADDMDEGEDIDEGSRPVPSPEGRGSSRTNR